MARSAARKNLKFAGLYRSNSSHCGSYQTSYMQDKINIHRDICSSQGYFSINSKDVGIFLF